MNSPTNIAAYRISLAQKQGLLAGETRKIDTRPAKLAAALDWLGKRYVCHKTNRVGKLPEPLPENYQWQPKPRTLRGRK